MILLIIASAAFGLGIGLYDLLLPFFLDHMGMSYGKMGIIFSFSAIFLFFIRIYAGHISDIVGRKHIFSLSLLFCGIANLFTPFFPYIVPQIFLKSFRESSVAIKETIQQLLIFDRWKDSFRHFLSWVAGFDMTFQGIGTILGGYLLVAIGYKYSFVFAGVFVLLMYAVFLFKFKEKFTPAPMSLVWGFTPSGNKSSVTNSNSRAAMSFSWLSPFKHRLSYPLVLLTISGFILEVGVSMSHCFIMPLFFYKKFAISYVLVSFIMAFHRLGFGLPMIIAGKVVKWNLKKTTIIFILIQGLLTALTVIPSYWLAASILWVLHDIIGASLWQPARNTLVQHYARAGSRGLDVGMVFSCYGLGWIFGPLIAGVISKYSINYPFLLSSVIVSISVIPLFWLKYSAKEQLPA